MRTTVTRRRRSILMDSFSTAKKYVEANKEDPRLDPSSISLTVIQVVPTDTTTYRLPLSSDWYFTLLDHLLWSLPSSIIRDRMSAVSVRFLYIRKGGRRFDWVEARVELVEMLGSLYYTKIMNRLMLTVVGYTYSKLGSRR